MTAVRTPTIAGLTPRSGTSTLAAALHGWDDGLIAGAADVVVCGASEASLRHAAAAVCCRPGPLPVLAVTLDAGTSGRGAWAARLQSLEPRFGAVVLLPHVARWRGLAAPLEEAAMVLGQPVEHLPRALRAYAGALRLVVAAMVGSGQLDSARPPAVTGPRSVQPWRGVVPAEKAVPLRPVLVATPAPVTVPLVAVPAPVGPSRIGAPSGPPVVELDDDELEAEAFLPTQRAC